MNAQSVFVNYGMPQQLKVKSQSEKTKNKFNSFLTGKVLEGTRRLGSSPDGILDEPS